MTQELVQLDHTELATPARPMGADEYREAVAEAGEKAKVLAEVVESCNLYATISGRKYLTVEAWQTIGVGYGITARIEWTHPLEGGGWEARAVAVDANNVERAAAEAEAGRSDDKPWDSRPAYQQRSMAQTRAVSKSLRSCLSWVVVLAGYAPTPAEEMPREADMIQQPKRPAPAKAAAKEKAPQETPVKKLVFHTGAEEIACPLHDGQFFELVEGFNGAPGEWKHKDGLWPEDHSNQNIAGKTRWCRSTDKEVQAVMSQPTTQPDLVEDAKEEEEDDHLF